MIVIGCVVNSKQNIGEICRTGGTADVSEAEDGVTFGGQRLELGS